MVRDQALPRIPRVNKKTVLIYHFAVLPHALRAKQQKAANFNQSEEAMSRVMSLIFAGTGILKIDSFVTVMGSSPMP